MVEVPCRGPFDLALCIRAARSFVRQPEPASPEEAADLEASASLLRQGVWLEGRPTLLEIRQVSLEPPVVGARTDPPAPAEPVGRLTAWVVNASMELGPFYAAVRRHPVLGPLTRRFHGLKPFRPASLFDMLVMAVTEQQISLAAAHHIQTRLVERFGGQVDGLPVFPRAETLAEASEEDLVACGLSHRKAEYIRGVGEAVASGALDLEALETASNDEVRARIAALRGFGIWSADYVLIRGMGRADVVPFDDLGVRRSLGQLLGDGHLLTPAEAADVLAPFAPHRGLAVFYLLVGSRYVG